MTFAPANRLVRFAVLVCPAALFAPLNSGLLALCLSLYGALAGVAIWDWARSRKMWHGLAVEVAPVTRLSLGNPGSIEVFIRREGPEPRRLSIGLPLDEALEAGREAVEVELAGKTTLWTVRWDVTPRRRGVYRIEAAFAQVRSRWGLWILRRRFATQSDVRVYPNLRRDRRQLANVFLNRGLAGTHLQRMIGQGRDYEQLREYLPGDSMFDIHWKATAKRGEPVTKTYQVERTREIYLIVDHSRLSGRIVAEGEDGGPPENALERFVTATSILNLVSARQGDLFGLVTYAHQISRFIRASSGRAHQQCVQDALFNLHPERTTPDIDELFTFLRLRLRRRALLIFLTDLSDPVAAEAFTNRLRMITGKHVTMVNMIVSREAGPLFRADPAVASIDDLYGALSGHLRWQDLSDLGRRLRRHGVSLGLLDQANLAVEVVNQYLRIKQRQLI